MTRDFSRRFRSLICESAPRTFLHKHEEETPHGLGEDLPEPKDGFVAQYCRAWDNHSTPGGPH